MVRVINWNGRDVPPELRDLPPGKYEVYEHDTTLSPDEDAAVQEGLDALDRGEVVSHEEVMRDLRERLKR